MGARGMHCTLDGIAIHDFLANLAAFTRGGDLAVRPHTDRTAYKARTPPKITHPHPEYSLLDLTGCFSNLGPPTPPPASHPAHLLHLPPTRIAALKSQAGLGSSAFVAVAAKLWRAQSYLMRLPDDRPLTMLFPVDVRSRVVPPAPEGYAGNFLIPGYARAAAGAVRGMGMGDLAREVREGMERLDDEYARSAIDWLEVNKGVPCGVDSFSVVAWSKLGLYEEEYRWGRAACFSPVVAKPGLVMLLPGEEEGGLSVCLELAPDLVREFDSLMTDDLYMHCDVIGVPKSPKVDPN